MATSIPRDVALHEAILWSANHSGFSHKLLVGWFNHTTIERTPLPYLPENIPPRSAPNTFVDCIGDYFLFQHITEPTRFREGQNPILDDLIFTSESEMLEQLKYCDHAALEFNFIFSIISSNLNRTALLYDKGDYEKMKQLFNRDWTQVLQSMNPQEAFDTLEKSLHQATGLYIPSKVIIDVGKRKKHHAWIRCLNTKSGEHYQDYIRARNESFRHDKRAYVDNIAMQVETSTERGVMSTVNILTKQLCRHTQASVSIANDKEGNPLKTEEAQAKRWFEQFSEVLNRESITIATDPPPPHTK